MTFAQLQSEFVHSTGFRVLIIVAVAMIIVGTILHFVSRRGGFLHPVGIDAASYKGIYDALYIPVLFALTYLFATEAGFVDFWKELILSSLPFHIGDPADFANIHHALNNNMVYFLGEAGQLFVMALLLELANVIILDLFGSAEVMGWYLFYVKQVLSLVAVMFVCTLLKWFIRDKLHLSEEQIELTYAIVLCISLLIFVIVTLGAVFNAWAPFSLLSNPVFDAVFAAVLATAIIVVLALIFSSFDLLNSLAASLHRLANSYAAGMTFFGGAFILALVSLAYAVYWLVRS